MHPFCLNFPLITILTAWSETQDGPDSLLLLIQTLRMRTSRTSKGLCMRKSCANGPFPLKFDWEIARLFSSL
jgi:hypothetical protein